MKPETLLYLLTVQLNVRLRHWQTHSYAEHVALGAFYDALDAFTDKLVETTQGINESRVLIAEGSLLSLSPMLDGDVVEMLQSLQALMTMEFSTERREIQNLRDDFLATVDKTLYLLTLK